MIDISQLNSKQDDFWQQLDQALAWKSVDEDQVINTVKNIIADVRKRGDEAIIEYTNKFDRLNTKDISELEISSARLQESLNKITAEQRTGIGKSRCACSCLCRAPENGVLVIY